MPRTNRHIRNFRGSRTGRHRPSKELNVRENIIQKISNNLYDPHWNYWNNKLLKMIEINQDAHGRRGNHRRFGLFYAGKAWFIPWMDATEACDFTILQLHSGVAEGDLIKITANLGELDVECYEIKRFLSGLFLFPAPTRVIEKLLGQNLSQRIAPYLMQLEPENEGRPWNASTAHAFQTYADEHDYLIKAMCQRVMMNLIARDAFAKR